jgi:hypothetical protein
VGNRGLESRPRAGEACEYIQTTEDFDFYPVDKRESRRYWVLFLTAER